ncbi:MAG TPA: ROK family protein [Solirubrobacteraceae bacterium]|jgi:predicted NBD/HSP70 family sugar kinase|nr:ROK family protein [Solirubrobacteraceae bacterium]
MTEPSADGLDREDSDVRFARALHRNGMRNARDWRVAEFRGPSQTAIAAEIGLSRPTVSGLVARAKDLLVDSRLGLRLDPTKNGYVVGIDFGQRHHRVALGDIHSQLMPLDEPGAFEVPGNDRPASISFEWAAERIQVLIDKAQIDASQIWAVGVSLPGAVNKRTRRLQSAPRGMDRSWEVVDVQLPDLPELPAPTVESDYNASALTEHLWGALRDRRDALYVKVSRRCSCSLLIDHRIYRGADGLAGRLGMTELPGPGETRTWVPVEDAFSLASIEGRGFGDMSASKLVELAKSADELDELLRSGARALGIALAPIIDAFNPESVVIGGALGIASLAWIAQDLIGGINWQDTPSPARSTISERLRAATYPSGTSIRGAMASALLAGAPERIVKAMAAQR